MLSSPIASNWCIGIYRGASPLRLEAAAGILNPVLTRHDVTDVEARFLADPFMLRVDGRWHMFFEVMRAEKRLGAIGHATSGDGRTWQYDRLVLDEPFHVSYPCVFAFDGAVYLVPESHQSGAIRLYEAANFPYGWTAVATIAEGEWVEPTIFRRDERWWLFAAMPARHATELHLFEADQLMGPWREHPASPVVRADPSSARPAGRVVEHDGRWLRFAQDCSRRYGEGVRAFEIVELTGRQYRERLVADDVLSRGDPWNAARMHHIDAHRLDDGEWLACVDGDDSR